MIKNHNKRVEKWKTFHPHSHYSSTHLTLVRTIKSSFELFTKTDWLWSFQHQCFRTNIKSYLCFFYFFGTLERTSYRHFTLWRKSFFSFLSLSTIFFFFSCFFFVERKWKFLRFSSSCKWKKFFCICSTWSDVLSKSWDYNKISISLQLSVFCICRKLRFYFIAQACASFNRWDIEFFQQSTLGYGIWWLFLIIMKHAVFVIKKKRWKLEGLVAKIIIHTKC